MLNIDMESIDLEKTYDLIVLGGGPTAIGCAIYAARFAMDVLVIGKMFGGLIATTHVVENYPAITSISGQGLMEMFKDHMNSLNIPYISDEIRSIVMNLALSFKILRQIQFASLLVQRGKNLEFPGRKIMLGGVFLIVQHAMDLFIKIKLFV